MSPPLVTEGAALRSLRPQREHALRTDLDLHDPAARGRLEEAIGQLPGVLATRLVAGFERPVDEVHVVTSVERNPKQTVRDIQSLLFANFDVTIDHRVVSIVQVESPSELRLAGRRLIIERVISAANGLETTVTVELRDGDRLLSGQAAGPASAAGRRRAAARATVEALRPRLEQRVSVEIEGVSIEDVLGHRLAITLVHLLDRTGDRTVSGTAGVRDDEGSAITRSVLDALNRELEFDR